MIRESSDDESDLENKKRPVRNQQTQRQVVAAPVSPKQTQQKKETPQEQPLNLLKTSIIASQNKKSPKPTPSPKSTESELEKALSKV